MKTYENEENLKEALFMFKNFMDDHGINFALIGGTLLGAYRNKRLLPWDEDLDVEFIFRNCEDFADTNIFCLLREAYRKGFVEPGWGHEFRVDDKYLKYPEISLLPKKQQWKEFLKIDPVWKVEKFGMFWQSANPSVELLKKASGYVHIDCLVSISGIHGSYSEFYNGKPLDNVILYGETFYTPPNPSTYFEYYYGKTWQSIYCSPELWRKHYKLLRDGHIPQEVDDFMKKWRPLLEET